MSKGLLILTFAVTSLFLSTEQAYAQAPASCDDNVLGKSEAQLQSDLALCNAEILKWQGILNGTRSKVRSIDGDVQALTAKIKTAEATIKSKNIAISQLTKDINIRSERIDGLESLIDEGKESLAVLIRNTRVIDDYSLAEVMFNSTSFSEFFTDLESFLSIQKGLKEHFTKLRQHISQNEDEKSRLGEIQDQERDAKYDVETKKKTIAANEQEKKEMLAATKLEAKSYEQIVADRQAKANQINAELFKLRGVDGGGIPFKEALAYAQKASAQTGVRAAFILAILRQESSVGENLGTNVGQCLLTNSKTGDGKGKNTGTPYLGVMKPDRDVTPFIDLLTRLGRDPYGTPISCPIAGGYGGAMGIMQFIPSTWKGYEGRIAQAFGVQSADPWNPQHAIMATGIYLQEAGGARGGYTAEREAAGRYYAGGGWATRGLSYAASVLGHAERYQATIDFLENR